MTPPCLVAEPMRWLLTGSFLEIVKATSLDNLMCAPPALREQFSVLAFLRNQNVKGELVQMICVFMIAYAEPSTNREASECLAAMEQLARKAFATQKQPERFKWEPLPGSAPIRGEMH